MFRVGWAVLPEATLLLMLFSSSGSTGPMTASAAVEARMELDTASHLHVMLAAAAVVFCDKVQCTCSTLSPPGVKSFKAATSASSSTSRATTVPTGTSLLPDDGPAHARTISSGRSSSDKHAHTGGPCYLTSGQASLVEATPTLTVTATKEGSIGTRYSCWHLWHVGRLTRCLRPAKAQCKLKGVDDSPAGLTILARNPSSCASHSMVALSVSISARMSPGPMESPSFFRHAAMLPCRDDQEMTQEMIPQAVQLQVHAPRWAGCGSPSNKCTAVEWNLHTAVAN